MNKKFTLSQNDLQDSVELVKKLVEIPTESPLGKGYEEFIHFLESVIKNKIPKIVMEIPIKKK